MSLYWIVVVTMVSLCVSVGARAQDTAAPVDAGAAVRKVIAAGNARDGEAFRAANRARADVTTLASGLQYRVLKQGDGTKPGPNDVIISRYRGTLIDGTVFTSSDEQRPAVLPINRLIKGWGEALQLMPVGSKWQLVIPPDLAYGARGTRGKVGPNATLVFEVELLAIKEAAGGSVTPTAAHSPVRPPASAGAIAEIRVAYKLDPRITKSMYMGERWVSPPTYTQVHTDGKLTVQATAYGVSGTGRIAKIIPTWTATDPTVVSISPAHGDLVSIAVLRAGESRVEVTSLGVTRKLKVKGEYRNGELVGSFIRQN